MTGTQIMLEWLKEKLNRRFTYLDIEQELPRFAKQYTDHYYRTDSFTRYFRFAKLELLKNGFELKEVEGDYKTWMVLPKEKELIIQMKF